jgi:hypothetical protein
MGILSIPQGISSLGFDLVIIFLINHRGTEDAEERKEEIC